MTPLEIQPCPICGNADPQNTRTLSPVGETVRVFCKFCETVYFAKYTVSPPTYDLKYNMKFFRESDLRKAQIMAPQLAALARSLRATPRILEIGPGNGLTLRELDSLGISAVGVDIDPLLCKYLALNFKVTVFPGGLENFTYEKQFDLIYSSHVIEHWNNPSEFMRLAKNLLLPHSILFIDSPDLAFSNDLDPNWHHFNTRDPFEHACILSQRSLCLLAHKHGFRVLRYAQFEAFGSFQAQLYPDP
jgi:SAM-dependent methyltransferase